MSYVIKYRSLINMNGRLYDPLIGRMLSPDIVIQDAHNSQAFNRYSYCFNNPLRFTDPSGYVTTIPPEFKTYYYPELIGNYDAYIDKLTELGAKNIDIHNTDESEGKTTTTISWSVGDNSFQMTIVDHMLRDYSQYCSNSCVADAFAAQEARLNGNKDLTPENIMSWGGENSCNVGLNTSDIILMFLKESTVYKNNRLVYMIMKPEEHPISYFEKRAYDEMYMNHGIFFNFYNNYIGHVVNASNVTQFTLNGVPLGYEIRIWDSGLDTKGNVGGFRPLSFFDPKKLNGKFGTFFKINN